MTNEEAIKEAQACIYDGDALDLIISAIEKQIPNEVYQKAISFYGERGQIGVAQEECAELIQALSKHLRAKGDEENIAAEIADVEIMLEQLKIIFDNRNRVEDWKEAKLIRLERRMNEANV